MNFEEESPAPSPQASLIVDLNPNIGTLSTPSYGLGVSGI